MSLYFLLVGLFLASLIGAACWDSLSVRICHGVAALICFGVLFIDNQANGMREVVQSPPPAVRTLESDVGDALVTRFKLRQAERAIDDLKRVSERLGQPRIAPGWSSFDGGGALGSIQRQPAAN